MTEFFIMVKVHVTVSKVITQHGMLGNTSVLDEHTFSIPASKCWYLPVRSHITITYRTTIRNIKWFSFHI